MKIIKQKNLRIANNRDRRDKAWKELIIRFNRDF